MKIIAHRNETPGCPENSIASLEYSAQEGIYAVECDVRRTGDGQYVIYHDPSLERLTGKALTVGEITVDEMRETLEKAGRALLTFDDLVTGYSKKTPVLLHVKEHTAWPDLINRFKKTGDMFIFGVESIEMLRAVRVFTPKERTLAFMPEEGMYSEFIQNGVGIIRLWEHWLDRVVPADVHAAGADQVWIMCNTPEKGMDGTPESLNRFVEMGADGALVSDVRMAKAWIQENQ